MSRRNLLFEVAALWENAFTIRITLNVDIKYKMQIKALVYNGMECYKMLQNFKHEKKLTKLLQFV